MLFPKRFLLLITLVFFAACSSAQKDTPSLDIQAESQLSPDERYQLIDQIIRYAGRMPSEATVLTRHESRFDDAYAQIASRHRLDFYHRTEEGREFLLISRDARSLHQRRVATGIEMQRDTTGRITHYNEHFRTWAMDPQELETKSDKLFRVMASGSDLSPWYPENSGTEEYIEFPNEWSRFDQDQRVWIRTDDHPLLEFYGLKEQL
ncbi:MAG: hypothetical protein LAT84_05380 [Balneolia bacterium]|nr:hypothetical protein [Balneolia bacterium]